jgi:DNA-directed RNA polymerase subunit RPC12/RpoP
MSKEPRPDGSQKKPQTEEEAVQAASDDELLKGIKKMGSELAKRRSATIEARRNRLYAVCGRCGNPLTQKQYDELTECPVCGNRIAIIVREDSTVEA